MALMIALDSVHVEVNPGHGRGEAVLNSHVQDPLLLTTMSHKAPVNISSSRRPFVLNAALIARAHTSLAYTAFSVALGVACLCHYKKIVKNDVAGYPQEWFPSVSATYV